MMMMMMIFAAVRQSHCIFYVKDVYNTRRFFFRDDECDGKTALGVTTELHCEQHVDVYVGMPCSAGLRSH